MKAERSAISSSFRQAVIPGLEVDGSRREAVIGRDAMSVDYSCGVDQLRRADKDMVDPSAMVSAPGVESFRRGHGVSLEKCIGPSKKVAKNSF